MNLPDKANETCVAQIAEALFGQPGMSLMEMANRRAEIELMRSQVERLDEGETQAIKERDHAESIIDKLCDSVLGSDRAEWSSAYYFEDAVDDVEDEVLALRKDAQRYRWLRNNAANGTRHDPAVLKDGPTDECEFMFGEELDSAIDAAAMKEQAE